MAFKQKVVQLSTSDAIVVECPTGNSGSVHGLIFSNQSTSSKTLTVKFFSQETGITSVIGIRKLKSGEDFTWSKPINVAPADKIIASIDAASGVSGFASIYLAAGVNPIATNFNPRGVYSASATYQVNDLAEVAGTSYICMVPNTINVTPARNSPNWMINSEKGEAGTGGGGGAGANTIHNGSGAPSSATGVDGDYYIDNANMRMYGPKQAGAWSNSFAIQGPAGATGATGAQGATGPTGAQGPQGLQGLAGANGKTIHNGTAPPSNDTGISGDYYVDTTNKVFYGPKSDVWSPGFSMVGPQGPAGTGSNTSTNIPVADESTQVTAAMKALRVTGAGAQVTSDAEGNITIDVPGTASTGGVVSTVNGVGPNAQGDVVLNPAHIGAAAVLGGNNFGGPQGFYGGFKVADKGVWSSNAVFNFATAQVQKITIGASLALSVSSWPGSGAFAELVIQMTNGGAHSVTFPTTNWIKPDGSKTTSLSEYMTALGRTGLQANGVDWIVLWTIDGGTTLYGKVL